MKQGQILVEAIVAISVAVVGLLGIFGLLSRSLSLNRVVGDQYIAANLATEGIELVKNILDNNAIRTDPWNTGVGLSNPEDCPCSIDYNDRDPTNDRAALVSRWERDSDTPLKYATTTGIYSYEGTLEKDSILTFYRRKILLSFPDPDQIKVNSIVNWKTRGGLTLSVDVEDHFFNWRPPPSCNFNVDPADGITAGQSATLSWSCLSTSSCSIDRGIGSVSTFGSTDVSPPETTIYIISCTGIQEQAMVIVQ